MTPVNTADNSITVTYHHAGTSVNTNELGMREMQARVWEHRDAHYLLVKAPPASGKSRALMFVALDKIFHQGVTHVIIAVPERSIGASFSSTPLSNYGFFADWQVPEENNLCTPGGDAGKVDTFIRFMNSPGGVLVCTHATLRFAYDRLDTTVFNSALVAVDEFHHVSADTENSRLGKLIESLLKESTAHILAMTGSYFRGDSVPVLSPEVESHFTPVTYNYYDQLNGYLYLKTLGIGHHFYQGAWFEALDEILDPEKKTIIHIPHVGSAASTKDKLGEVDEVLDHLGTVISTDPESGIITVQRHDGQGTLKVADLVNDTDTAKRARTLNYLTTVAAKERDGVDIIIALGMAKEGFDWPFAEHALTAGYRASLTEVIQIIGRVTRDCEGKNHAQFTNLIARPDETQDDITVAVNNTLKAITASLLMEQVLAENMSFKSRKSPDQVARPGEVLITGLREPSTDRVRQIVATDLNDLKAQILQSEKLLRMATIEVEPKTINRSLIPRIITERYPDLTPKEVEEVRQQVVVDSVMKNAEFSSTPSGQFVMAQNKYIHVTELNISLIDSINPFQRAFEVLSKDVDTNILRLIQDAIIAHKVEVDPTEARIAFRKIQEWVKLNGHRPNVRSQDLQERRYAEILLWFDKERRRRERETAELAASGELL